MACNADARVHHFYFNSCDDANDFIEYFAEKYNLE